MKTSRSTPFRLLSENPRPAAASAGALLGAALLAGACSGSKPPAEAPSSATQSVSEERPEADTAEDTSAPPSAPAGGEAATETELAEAEIEALEPMAEEAAPVQPGPPPPLPKGTTVLHIGDSFAGALGIELNKQLKEHGVRGILKYETSTYIPTWAWRKPVDQYMWNYRPDLVIITLGANELEIPDPQMRAKTIRHLVERIGDRPCVWVAPPLWEGARDALLPVIEENCAPCVYMSNEDIAKDMKRTRDKIHPAMSARPGWAAHVIDWLARHRVPDAERPWELKADPAGAEGKAATPANASGKASSGSVSPTKAKTAEARRGGAEATGVSPSTRDDTP